MNKEILGKVKKYLKDGRKCLFNANDDIYSKEKSRRLKKISLSNGKFFILPIDQGLEHGPVDFLINPAAEFPEFQLDLACEVGFSAIAMQYGLAKRYWRRVKYKKNIPLIVKINGKTQLPKIAPFSILNASVEEAVDLGADAIGYTMYVGSEQQADDLRQFAMVRKEAEKNHLPVIVWAYPRGNMVDADGGKNSVAVIDYAVRVAMEMGADVVKFNLPAMPENEFNQKGIFADYNSLAVLTQKELLQKVVNTAGTMGTLLSGGDLDSKKQVLENAKLAMECGVDGVIFGRNIWQREYKEAVDFARRLKSVVLGK